MDRTVVYYTSNREDEVFEQKIRKKLLASIGHLPLISVSQKPIDFGYNICVGDVGVSDQNVHRQLQIGALKATTPFIISAESDCIYPKEYFKFNPPIVDRAYRCDNVFILNKNGGGFRRKAYSECGQIAGREYLIKSIDKFFEGKGQWSTEKIKGHGLRYLFGYYHSLDAGDAPWDFFHTVLPIINIKTDKGLHKSTRVNLYDKPVDILPFWGSADQIRKEMFYADNNK